jgi:hypothetical protein
MPYLHANVPAKTEQNTHTHTYTHTLVEGECSWREELRSNSRIKLRFCFLYKPAETLEQEVISQQCGNGGVHRITYLIIE